MKKRVFAMVLMLVMLLGMLAACDSNEPLTDAEVQQIVKEHLGEAAKDLTDIHSHIAETEKGEICFNVFVTLKSGSFTYQVHAVTGEILSITEGGHSH